VNRNITNVNKPSKNATLFYNWRGSQKMRVESTISDKSSVCFILTRARRLGILTFDKIKKIVFQHKNNQNKTKSSKYTIILSKQNAPQKIDVKIFLWDLNSIANKTLIIYVCSEIIPITIGQKLSQRCCPTIILLMQ
ncbi:MAG: hypothetical protein LUD00_10995, partial [Prevotellaceae bacterium]|nr:hypothetical protein [Prevotellaceae bacterium]